MQNRHGWTRRLDGNIDIKTENITTEKKVIEFKVSDETKEYIAEFLSVLFDSGALESGEVGEFTAASAH